jgi:hypothetical protein
MPNVVFVITDDQVCDCANGIARLHQLPLAHDSPELTQPGSAASVCPLPRHGPSGRRRGFRKLWL